jgi:ERF superfamily
MDTNELELKAKLYQKIWAVMGEVDFVAKDGKVQSNQTNYKYASEAAIKEAVHPALVKHRLLFFPYRSEVVERHAETTKNKFGEERTQTRTTVKLCYRFLDIDTGYGEEGEIHGDGQDGGDKGIYKAFTGAFKYVFHMGLVIPTGDDPERQELSREEKKQIKVEGHAQQQQIAERKIAQMDQPQPEVWDWRIALPRYESYEKHYGKAETLTALQMAGYNSIEDTPSREAALAALDKVKAILSQPKTEQPSKAKLDPALEIRLSMNDFKGRHSYIQQKKFDLVRKFGQAEGERRYKAVLAKHGGPGAHSNEIARDRQKSTDVASELYLELYPEAEPVEEPVEV